MAKILGQLESAQLENLAADPTPASLGRVYLNIATPAAPQPKIYTTTGWRNLLMGQATATIVSSSGKNVTVNWANGLTQQVNLTDNCLITFSNPVEGSLHTLIVQQVAQLSTSNVPYTYKFADGGLDSKRGPYQPSGVLIPFGQERTHMWLYKAGIKPARSVAPAATTAGITPYLPGAAIFNLAIHPMQYAIVGTKVASPFTYYNYLRSAYPNGNGPLNAFGGVTSVAAPVAAAIHTAFSPDGEVYAMATTTTPFAQSSYCGNGKETGVYPTNTYVSPVALAGNGAGVSWHPSSQFVAVGNASSPFIYVFPHNRSSWGTKITDPATLPPGAVTGVDFSPFGDFVSVVSTTTPFIRTYPFSVASGGSFGAVVANPGTLPAGGATLLNGKAIAWRPQGDFIAMAMNVTPFFYVIPFDRTTGSYGTPITISGTSIPTGSVATVQWSPDGQYLYVVVNGGALSIFDFSSQTIGTPVTWTTIPVALNDISVDPNGEIIYFSSTASPFLGAVEVPTKARSYVPII